MATVYYRQVGSIEGVLVGTRTSCVRRKGDVINVHNAGTGIVVGDGKVEDNGSCWIAAQINLAAHPLPSGRASTEAFFDIPIASDPNATVIGFAGITGNGPLPIDQAALLFGNGDTL